MGLLDSYAPSMKFEVKGRRQGGRVVRDAAEIQQRDFDTNKRLWWAEEGGKSTDQYGPRGEKRDPALQLVVTVETGVPAENGDTQRAIYVKGQMLKATREACRLARVNAIREGAEFYVTYVDDEPPPNGRKGKPSKVYTVQVVAPAGGVGILADPPQYGNHAEQQAYAQQAPVAAGGAEPADPELAARQAEAMDRLARAHQSSPIMQSLTGGRRTESEPPF